MACMSKFIFFDRKKTRFSKFLKILSSFIISINILLFLSIISIYRSPDINTLGYKLGKEEIEKVIDTISTKKEAIIEVKGKGSIISLKGSGKNAFLLKEAEVDAKSVTLSFDDGPDALYTDKILDILKEFDVKAVFFVLGENLLESPKVAKRIVSEGHQIGVHTFTHTHEYDYLYENPRKVHMEIDLTQKIIQAQTGYSTSLFRNPYWGAEDTISVNSLVLTVNAIARGYAISISTLDSNDWLHKNSWEIIRDATKLSSGNVLLFHDSGGNREATIKALPEIIKIYKENGYQFKTLDPNLAGIEGALMRKISVKDKILSNIAINTFLFPQYFNKLVKIIFNLGILLFVLNSLFYLVLVTKGFILRSKSYLKYKPFISVLVPARNEEKSLRKTLDSILNSNYKNYEIVVIDNKSTDNTYEIARSFKKTKKVRVVKENTQGKYAALNKGIKVSKGTFLVIIDADTQILPTTLDCLIKKFSSKKIGAVGGNIKVGNIKNLLTAFQAIEYIVSLNLDRRGYSNIGSIPVVPGALGAWRKSVLVEAKGYLNDTLTEDAELTARVQSMGYKTVFAPDALAYTEAPTSIAAFIKQRFRWNFGTMQVMYKYRKYYFKKDRGILFMLILPFITLVQFPFMILAPFFEIVAIYTLLSNPMLVIKYFTYFLLIALAFNIIAFVLARERRVWLLLLTPLTRIYYQYLWYIVLAKSLYAIVKGGYYPWNKMKHTGSVELQYSS